MNSANYGAYYRRQLDDAQAFQDYIARQLLREGIVLVNFQSRASQLQWGENTMGIEIKFDRQFATTGNLWIEVCEKGNPTRAAYVDSGINRPDNAWLLGIGNHREFFIFSTRTLQLEVAPPCTCRPRRLLIENNTRTSRGFLLPRRDIASLAERCFIFAEREPGEDG